jgi:hypothetical protein
MANETSETPLFDLLAKMTADSIEVSPLDAHTFMVARIAALIAVNAPPASYIANLRAAGLAEVTADEVRGVAMAVAPVVGTTRIIAAAGNVLRAFGLVVEAGALAEAVAEEEEEDDADEENDSRSEPTT